MRAASAAAAPPDDPPAERSRAYGLRVVPKSGLNVCDPSPNSGTLVIPMMIAPAARSRDAITPSSAGTRDAYTGEPWVYGMPATGVRSLTANGIPCSGGRSLRGTASAAAASARSSSACRMLTIALTAGLRRAMRSRNARMTETAESSPERSAPASATALSFVGSPISAAPGREGRRIS